MEELMQRIDKTSGLLIRVEKLKGLKGSNRLKRKFLAELRFLEDLKAKNEETIDRHLHSSNLPFLEAVLKITESLTGVEDIFANYFFIDDNNREKNLTVDIVSKGETQWIKVIARNPKALYRTWLGQGQYGSKDICELARDFLFAKKYVCMDPDMTTVVFHFESGIIAEMEQALRDIGVLVSGDILLDNTESGAALCVKDAHDFENVVATEVESRKVNLDITALVAIVSSVTNGNCHHYFNDDILNQQAKEERTDPVLPKINEFLIGKEMYVCRTAYNDFCSILSTVGGVKEKERADELLSKAKIIDDNPSEKSQTLVESGRIKGRSKIIFGTGDTIKATTLTANASFVRAANNQGVKFRVFFHASRALTEQKEPVS